MNSGTVKWFNEGKGFGFISNDNGEGTFSSISPPYRAKAQTLAEGQKVAYDTETDPKDSASCAPSTSASSEDRRPSVLHGGGFYLRREPGFQAVEKARHQPGFFVSSPRLGYCSYRFFLGQGEAGTVHRKSPFPDAAAFLPEAMRPVWFDGCSRQRPSFV